MKLTGKVIQLFILIFVSGYYLQAQNYEIRFDSLNASGWFGGDNRPDQKRNVAVAQSVFIEEPITIDSFAFYYTAHFDYALNGTGTGHEVILKLQIRDSVGSILQIEQTVVPDSFTGGWITWSNINLDIIESGRYIFSAYLVGGYDSNQVFSGQGCDLNAGYSDGEMYVKYISSDSDAEVWGDWSLHSWDSNFWLAGTLVPTDAIMNDILIKQFKLEQNYPNPFNPTTIISWQSAVGSWQTLKIYDVLGNEIVTLVDEYRLAGNYEITFDAGDLPSGIYFYKLSAGGFIQSHKMLFLK